MPLGEFQENLRLGEGLQIVQLHELAGNQSGVVSSRRAAAGEVPGRRR